MHLLACYVGGSYWLSWVFLSSFPEIAISLEHTYRKKVDGYNLNDFVLVGTAEWLQRDLV